jgi:hypothetical protein
VWAFASPANTSLSWVFAWDAFVGALKGTSRRGRQNTLNIASPKGLNTAALWPLPLIHKYSPEFTSNFSTLLQAHYFPRSLNRYYVFPIHQEGSVKLRGLMSRLRDNIVADGGHEPSPEDQAFRRHRNQVRW